jgi:hypothetical protein
MKVAFFIFVVPSFVRIFLYVVSAENVSFRGLNHVVTEFCR